METENLSFLKVLGPAQKSQNPRDVVIGLGPSMSVKIFNTIGKIPLRLVLREILAGIEEEGMQPRLIKILDSSDLSFIGKKSANLSGSGVAVGLQSKGTALIHHRELFPLTNLELFPQAPLLTLDTYRAIGKNASRYARGEQAMPIPSANDPMCRPKFQVKAALMHIVETDQVQPTAQPVEVALI